MNDRSKNEKLFDLFVFLLTSARGSLEEGVLTASLRLIDAAGRMSDLMELLEVDDVFVREMGAIIKKGMTRDYLASQEKYVGFLDSVLEKLGTEIRERNGF